MPSVPRAKSASTRAAVLARCPPGIPHPVMPGASAHLRAAQIAAME